MLAIIINPKSGKKAFRAQRIYLWRLLRRRHESFTYRVTRYANHAIEQARELVEMGYDRILVLGGDGTLSEVINGIMRANVSDEQRRKISFGLMPRGTGNDWGRYWNLTRDYKLALDRFFRGSPHPVDVGCVTYWRNNVEHHRWFINSVGFGVDPLCCSYAEKLKPYIGSHHVNYLFGLFAALVKMKPIHMQLVADGKEVVTAPLYTMNIGNGPYSGGGIRQNPEADPQDGIFHSMFVEKPTFVQILKAIGSLFNGKLKDLPFVHSYSGADVRLNTKEYLRFEADGILMDIMGPCRVTCLRHALNMYISNE